MLRYLAVLLLSLSILLVMSVPSGATTSLVVEPAQADTTQKAPFPIVKEWAGTADDYFALGVQHAKRDVPFSKYDYTIRGMLAGTVFSIFAPVGTWLIGPETQLPPMARQRMLNKPKEYQLAYESQWKETSRKFKRGSYLLSSTLVSVTWIALFAYYGR